MVAGYMPWIVGGGSGQAGGYAGTGGVMTIAQRKILFIAFDENDRVTRFEIVSPWTTSTIRECAIKWADAKSKSKKLPEKFEMSTIPEGKSVIYLYRPAGISDTPYKAGVMIHDTLSAERDKPTQDEPDAPFIVPGVWIDDILLDEMRKFTYSTAIVSPGVHTIFVNPIPNPSEGQLLRAYQKPVKTITIETESGKAYFIKLRINWPGILEPVLTFQSETDAIPVLKKLKHISNLTL